MVRLGFFFCTSFSPIILHKKWNFPIKVSSVNVKFAEEILNGKLHFCPVLLLSKDKVVAELLKVFWSLYCVIVVALGLAKFTYSTIVNGRCDITSFHDRFVAKNPFLYPLKTSENLGLRRFRGYRKGTFAWNGLSLVNLTLG